MKNNSCNLCNLWFKKSSVQKLLVVVEIRHLAAEPSFHHTLDHRRPLVERQAVQVGFADCHYPCAEALAVEYLRHYLLRHLVVGEQHPLQLVEDDADQNGVRHVERQSDRSVVRRLHSQCHPPHRPLPRPPTLLVSVVTFRISPFPTLQHFKVKVKSEQ